MQIKSALSFLRTHRPSGPTPPVCPSVLSQNQGLLSCGSNLVKLSAKFNQSPTRLNAILQGPQCRYSARLFVEENDGL